MISSAVILSALELGCIYALVALALYLSYRTLNIADMTTDGAFTLGCAVSATLAVAGHPILAIPAAMIAGALAGFVTAFLQTKMKIPSILAGIITNTGLYTVNLAVMGFSSNVNMLKSATVFTMVKPLLGTLYRLIPGALIAAVAGLFGLTAGFIVLVGHLAGLQCLEVPYLAPFHKGRANVLRDRMVTDKFRDSLLHPEDRRKQV